MTELSPEELVRWCQQTLPDDTRAFEALLTRYKQSVFATACRLMGNRDDAEEQAQEVFLKIYRNIKNLSEPATLPAWIHRITTNTCLDALEKQQRRRRLTPTVSIQTDEAEEIRYVDKRTTTPEEDILRAEVRKCLEKALAKLDADGRSVLVLRDINDLSYHEIAEALAIGLSAVKMRIHRARLAFQKLLHQVCPGVWSGGDSAIKAPTKATG